MLLVCPEATNIERRVRSHPAREVQGVGHPVPLQYSEGSDVLRLEFAAHGRNCMFR
jgi:hypothetical protein